MEKEIWKDIPGWEGYYQASSLGRVRSLDRLIISKVGAKRFFKGKILILHNNHRGYIHVRLGRGGKLSTITVHQIVARTFHKKPKYKCEVLHLNDVKTDNRAVNLKWGTNVENMKSAWTKGLVRVPFAWERKKSKYGKETYKKIVELYNTGEYNPHQISVLCNYPMYCIYNFVNTYNKHKKLIDKMLF